MSDMNYPRELKYVLNEIESIPPNSSRYAHLPVFSEKTYLGANGGVEFQRMFRETFEEEFEEIEPEPKKKDIFPEYKPNYSQTRIFKRSDRNRPAVVLFRRLNGLGARVAEELCSTHSPLGFKHDFSEVVFASRDWAKILGGFVADAGGTEDDKLFWKDYAKSKGACLVTLALMDYGYHNPTKV